MLNVSISEQYSFNSSFSTYRNSEPINSAQERILKKIQQSNYENTASRTVSFLLDNPGKIAEAFIPNKEEVVNLICWQLPVASVCIPIAVCVPAAQTSTAIVAGGILAIWYGVVTIPKLAKIKDSDFYLRWKEIRNDILQKNNIIEYLLEDDQLKYFTCKLSGKLPLIAVKIKGHDQIYDLEEITDWINKNPNEKNKLTGKKLKLEDLVFDFPHMYSMMERLENLRQKTILALDPQAYTYNEVLNETFNEAIGIDAINSLVRDYIGMTSVVELQEDDTYKIISTRDSHPVLENLYNQTKVFQRWINENKFQLRQACRTQMLEEDEKVGFISSKSINEFLDAYKSLNQRKILWYYRDNSPVLSKPVPDEPIPWGKVIPAAILLSPLLLPILAGVGSYISTSDMLRERSKALKVIDLTEELDERIAEYGSMNYY